MIKKTLLTILAVLFACFLLAEESAAFLQNIVERISQIESRYHSMKQVIEIDHYKSGKKEKSSKIKVLSLNDKSLIVLLAPENQKGKVILKKGVSNYLYFPKANRYTRVSARSSLFGNVVIGDIAMPPLLESYNYKLLSRKQKGDTLKVVIEFTAKQGKKLAFAKKVCYYRQYKDEPGLLQKVESFTSSDLLLAPPPISIIAKGCLGK